MLLRKVVSWLSTTFLFLICIGLNIFVFWLQNLNVDKSQYQSRRHKSPVDPTSASTATVSVEAVENTSWTSLFWLYVVPCLMYFVREMMTYTYYIFAKKITLWEGNVNYSEFRYSFILKRVFSNFLIIILIYISLLLSKNIMGLVYMAAVKKR